MTGPLETDYVHALMARAALEFPDVRLFRRNTGMMRLEHKGESRMFRAGIPGQCDLYGLSKGGRHFEIEVKRFGKLSEAQTIWRAWCAEWNVPWLCVMVRKDEQQSETITRWIGELRELFTPG